MTTKRQSKTCIALIRLRDGRLMMGGDRRVSESWSSAYQCPFPKISKKENGMLMGASGDSAICKLVIDIFNPPQIIEEMDTYMFYSFQKQLTKLLLSQPGFKDQHNLLQLPPETCCHILVASGNRAYIVMIENNATTQDLTQSSSIVIDDLPIPYVIGCGAASAFPILHTSKTKFNRNTKAQLIQAMVVASELSPGCDRTLDFITSDVI